MTKLPIKAGSESIEFLRSRNLQTDGECSSLDLGYLNETVFKEEGSYKVSYGSNVTVFSTGEIILNYNDTANDELNNNLIDMVNITGTQRIVVNGFMSQNLSTPNVQIIEIPIALLIGVAAFGIYGPGGLIIVPVLLSPSPSSDISVSSQVEVGTEIKFEGGEQSIILNNVRSEDITVDNFIFACNSTSDGNEGGRESFPLDLILGLSIGIGVPALAGLSYIGYKKLIGAGVPEPDENIA